ncbi:MAG: diguanylate cyclase, partial [Chloroflexota bacterium]
MENVAEQRRVPEAAVWPKLGRLGSFYMGEVIALAAFVLLLGLREPSGTTDGWLRFIVLVVPLMFAELLPAATNGRYTSRPAVAFFAAGVILLGSPWLEMLVIAWTTGEAVRSARPWQAIVLDGAVFLVATRAASVAQGVFTTALVVPFLPASVLPALVATATLLVVARLLFRVHTVLATGGVQVLSLALTDETLFAELGLGCVGVTFAFLWLSNPWLASFAFLPIVPVSRGLKVTALEEEASLEPKTLLLNVRAFNRLAEKERARAERKKGSCALLVADLDYLRDVNNKHGHLAGDLVLQRVARVIRSSLPERAFASRFGGEEFCVLVPDADATEGLQVAETIRQRVADELVFLPTSGEAISITISLGVATYPYNSADLRGVMADADAAVYRAKMGGRNRVCVAFLHDKTVTADQIKLFDPGARKASPRAAAGVAKAPSALPRAQRNARARIADAYAYLVAFAGPALAILAIIRHPIAAPWEGLFAITALAVVAEGLAIDGREEKQVSPSFVALLAGVLLYGVPAAVVAACGIALARTLANRGGARNFAFTFGALTIAGTASALAFSLFGRPLAFALIVPALLPALIAGMAGYLIHATLCAVAVGLDTGRAVVRVWQDLFRWLVGYYLLMSVLATLLAAAYASFGLAALIAFSIPVLAMRYAFKQYLDRTSESEAELAKANNHLRSTYENTLLALVAALDARDHDTEGHSQRVAGYAVKIGETMGLDADALTNLRLGALLHDIGKIGLPDAILRKCGPLNEGEWSYMRDHPSTGFTILQGIEFLGGPSQV